MLIFLVFYMHCGRLVVESVRKWWKVGDQIMFTGEYRHSLDAKKRLIIPAKFRDELGDTFVVTIGLDGCLTIYTDEEWLELASQLKTLPSTKKEARQYVRYIASKAQACEFDGQGRIQLPQSLLTAANIQKKCVVIGAIDHVEIWSEESWNQYDDDAGSSFENVAESLTEYMH